jgi:hypothetical protein
MNSQEESNSNFWCVLQKIKQHHIHTQTGDLISYDIHLLSGNNNELEILKKLSKWKAIQIVCKRLNSGLRISVYLYLIQPRFNEIYRKFHPFQQPDFNHSRLTKYSCNERDYSYKYPSFTENYLFKEAEQFEQILKHFLRAGAISLDDYGAINSKMMKILLRKSLNSKRIKRMKRKRHHHYGQKSSETKQLPLPITGEIVVSGLNESLKALRPKSPQNSGLRFPYKIPAGTCWNNIIIKFLNDKQVEIWVKKLKHVSDFKEMGMIGKGKIASPSEQWLFLRVLAKCYGELSIKDPEAKDKYKKQKQALSETLRNYFSIDYDPFYPYQSCQEKGGNSYKIKLVLIPPPVKNNLEKSIDSNDDADALGIHEFLNETAPQVLES